MSFKRTLTASIIMIATMIFAQYMSYSEDIKLNKPFSTFPKKIGEWTGKEEHFDQAVYDLLGVDDSYLADYYNANGKGVNLYIGYYQNQREGEQIHSPKNCMPGGGWNITGSSLVEIPFKGSASEKINVIKLLLEKDGQKQVVLYWYQSNGRYISSEYAQKIYMVIDSITKHRTDASFIRLIAAVSGNDEETALGVLKSFAGELIPILEKYIPS
jgi:EpsI family protein